MKGICKYTFDFIFQQTKLREMYKQENTKCLKVEGQLKEDKVKQQRMETEIILLKAKVICFNND